MAVPTVRSTDSVGYGSASVARAPGAVRDAVTSLGTQIDELNGSQLAGPRAEASTPDGFEGFGNLPRAAAAAAWNSSARQLPNFSSMGLAPMAYFAQERSDSSSSSGSLRNLGPNASSRGAGTYEFAKRTIEGGPEARYRYS